MHTHEGRTKSGVVACDMRLSRTRTPLGPHRGTSSNGALRTAEGGYRQVPSSVYHHVQKWEADKVCVPSATSRPRETVHYPPGQGDNAVCRLLPWCRRQGPVLAGNPRRQPV